VVRLRGYEVERHLDEGAFTFLRRLPDREVRVRWRARTIHRVKPDPEVNPLAELDYEEGATSDQDVPDATPLRASTSA
jgi:hypothetical protein